MREDTAKSIEELARKLSSRMGVKKELKKLPMLIHDDEQVLELDTGTYDGGHGLVVATDRRVMFILEGLGRSRLEEFPLDEIAAVKSEVVLGSGRLTISTYSDQVQICDMSKPMVEQLTEYLHSRIDGAAATRDPAAPNDPPVMESEAARIEVILIGVFEPCVFQPEWFSAEGLLSRTEASQASILENSEDRVTFTTDAFEMRARRGQLLLGTARRPSFHRLSDLVAGLLAVSQPEVAKLGINIGADFALPSVEAWSEIAERLAPSGYWDRLLPDARLRKLTLQGPRPDGQPGSVVVHVEPSNRLRPGVYVQVNDQFELPNGTPGGVAEAARIVSESWGQSMTQAVAICRKVFAAT